MSPAESGGSKPNTNSVPSVGSIDVGARTDPVGSSNSKPSPAGDAGFVKLTVIWSTGPSTVSPSDGVEETKSVCAEATFEPLRTTMMTVSVPRRNLQARRKSDDFVMSSTYYRNTVRVLRHVVEDYWQPKGRIVRCCRALCVTSVMHA